MGSRKNISTIILVCVCLLLLTACSVNTAVPTQTPTQTAIPPTPTKTERPTTTPEPTYTPNAVQTQNYDDIFSDIQKFVKEGLIPSSEGTYNTLPDFSETLAQRGFLTYWYFDFIVEQFVYKAHISWSTAGETNETSGCGIIFGINPWGNSNDYYGVVLDKSRIFFSSTHWGYYYDMGKSRGTGTLSFGNPAEADITLLVYDYKAHVYVDDEFIGEYTLSMDRELKGKFGYGIISGTNHDYGTRCKISNSRLWPLNK